MIISVCFINYDRINGERENAFSRQLNETDCFTFHYIPGVLTCEFSCQVATYWHLRLLNRLSDRS